MPWALKVFTTTRVGAGCVCEPATTVSKLLPRFADGGEGLLPTRVRRARLRSGGRATPVNRELRSNFVYKIAGVTRGRQLLSRQHPHKKR